MTQSSRLKTIEHTVALTNEWLHELDKMLDWDDLQRSYRLLREALHAIRDCLGVDEAAHLASEMPILIRGVYYEGWHPAATPVSENDKQAFVQRVDRAFEKDPLDDTESAIRLVFAFLSRRISEGEINDVRTSMPRDLRQLWPS